MVLYFYPRDNTPGCTLETNDFAKLYKKFRSHKYEVIGISKDDMKSHLGFKKKYKLPFELLSDENVLAIAADYKILDVSLPIFHLDEISKIANFILKKVGLK